MRAEAENFLIVVTFKELYLGNGQDFYDAIAKDKIDKLLAKYSGQAPIPLRNIYFITVDDLDYLLTCATKASGLVEILKRASRADKDPKSKTFTLRQHLQPIVRRSKLPDHIRNELDGFAKQIGSYIKQEMGSISIW